MPKWQREVESLARLCVEKVYNDRKTVYDFDGILPELAIEIFYGKCREKVLKENQICQLIKPGLVKLHLDLWNSKFLPQVLRTIGETQRHLKDLTLKVNLCLKKFGPRSKFIKLSDDVYEALAPALQKVVKLALNFGAKEILHSINNYDNLEELVYLTDTCTMNIHDSQLELAKYVLKTFKNLKSWKGPDDTKIMMAIYELYTEDPNFKTAIKTISVLNRALPGSVQTEKLLLKDLFRLVPMTMTTKIEELLLWTMNEEEDLSYFPAMTPSLKTIKLFGNNKKRLSPSFYKLLSCHGSTLTEIDIWSVGHTNVEFMIDKCPNLRKLHLCLFSLPFDASFPPIETCKPLKWIESLRLSYMCIYRGFDLGQSTWMALLGDATKLKHLDLGFLTCSGLILALKKIYHKHKFPSLETLDMRDCYGIEMNDLLPIIEESDNPLRRVKILKCPKISHAEVKAYEKRLKSSNITIDVFCRQPRLPNW